MGLQHKVDFQFSMSFFKNFLVRSHIDFKYIGSRREKKQGNLFNACVSHAPTSHCYEKVKFTLISSSTLNNLPPSSTVLTTTVTTSCSVTSTTPRQPAIEKYAHLSPYPPLFPSPPTKPPLKLHHRAINNTQQNRKWNSFLVENNHKERKPMGSGRDPAICGEQRSVVSHYSCSLMVLVGVSPNPFFQ
ncbi:hypothetical protein RIF29_29467 [Crotalaria pallida]|uniref:Uncharacterized protein n=1 Tax=Crotalaria pallida TaxID=3830 RepID=A0AAN9EJU5_CROPI